MTNSDRLFTLGGVLFASLGFLILLVGFAPQAHASTYLDDFEGDSGGTFLTPWATVTGSASGVSWFDISTVQAYSPTHSFGVSAVAPLNNSAQRSSYTTIASSTAGSLTSKVYVDSTISTALSTIFKYDISVRANTTQVGIGLSYTMNGGTYSFKWDCTTTDGCPLSLQNALIISSSSPLIPANTWTNVGVYWRDNAGARQYRIQAGTIDTGWKTASSSPSIQYVMLQHQSPNTGALDTDKIFFDNIQVQNGADAVDPDNVSTRIAITNPTQGTTTPSTTFTINANYTIGTDLSHFSLDGSVPNRVGINLVLQNALNGITTDLGTDYAISQAVGSYTYSTTTTATQSDYTLIATLVGDYGFTPAPSGCIPLPPFVTCTGSQNTSSLAFNTSTFSVANGTISLIGFNSTLTGARNALATTTCDVTHIGGCFQNALAFLFYPSPDALAQFQFLWYNIKSKPPFGYVTETITALSTLNETGTPAFSFGNIPFITAIFTPIKVGLASLLWLLFGVTFYTRLKHLDI